MHDNDELTKSLVSLIDETISEIDELRKSKFAAAEVSLHGPGGNLNEKAPGSADENGSLGKEEDEKDEDDDKDEDDKDDAKKADDCEKAANREADPSPGFPHGKAEGAKKAEVEKAANREADPSPGFPHGKASEAKKAEDKDDDDKDDKKKDKKKDMEKADGMLSGSAGGVNMAPAAKAEQPAEGYHIKKSAEEADDLMKSYVDSKVAPLEEKLKAIHALVEKIADQPVPSKRFTSQAVPLSKSEDEFESAPLSKSEVTKKLFELKKSGKEIDDLDFTKIDLGADLGEIARKYGFK